MHSKTSLRFANSAACPSGAKMSAKDNSEGWKFEWDDFTEERLILMWEENKFLYNLESKDYINTEKKRRVFAKMAEHVGTTCKYKFHPVFDRPSTLNPPPSPHFKKTCA